MSDHDTRVPQMGLNTFSVLEGHWFSPWARPLQAWFLASHLVGVPALGQELPSPVPCQGVLWV